jgi:hypothetical protein
MPHSQAFRYFLHRHQELIAEPIKSEKQSPRFSRGLFALGHESRSAIF